MNTEIEKREKQIMKQLIEKYNNWIADQGLPLMSADELAWEDCVNVEQRKWLVDFIQEWEEKE